MRVPGLGSRKEPLESWDDVRDAFQHLRERYIDRYTWHRGIVQRYKDGRLDIHIHIAQSPLFQIEGKDECWVVSVASGELGVDAASHADDLGLIDDADCQQRQPMLVLVYEGVEIPERLRSTLPFCCGRRGRMYRSLIPASCTVRAKERENSVPLSHWS